MAHFPHHILVILVDIITTTLIIKIKFLILDVQFKIIIIAKIKFKFWEEKQCLYLKINIIINFFRNMQKKTIKPLSYFKEILIENSLMQITKSSTSVPEILLKIIV